MFKQLGWAFAATGILVLAAPPVAAHHPANTARVGEHGTRAFESLLVDPSAPARILAEGGYQLIYFGSALRGSENASKAALGRVMVELGTARLGLETVGGLRLNVLLPFGSVMLTPSAGESRTQWGLGDLRIMATQDFDWTLLSEQRFRFSVSAGFSAPTGRYDPDSGLDYLELNPGEQGALTATNYFSQANLGIDSWTLQARGDIRWRPNTAYFFSVSAALTEPFSDTREAIHWGRDTGAMATAGRTLGSESWVVSTGLGYLSHSSNRIPGPEYSARGGSSQELGVQLAIEAKLTGSLACGLGANLPIWQHAAGVQLMKTFASSTSCQWSLDI